MDRREFLAAMAALPALNLPDPRPAPKDTSSKDNSLVEVMRISSEELHSFSPEQNNLVLSVSDPCYT